MKFVNEYNKEECFFSTDKTISNIEDLNREQSHIHRDDLNWVFYSSSYFFDKVKKNRQICD